MSSHCEKDQFAPDQIPDLTGYVAIVTGGNSGIGYETALQLAFKNARVYIAGRSKERVDQAIQGMSKASNDDKLDLHFLELDLQNLKQVKAAAKTFGEQESRLDILINNAGIMAAPFKLTADGYESQWQVNYLAPFLFTSCVLPLMQSTAAQLTSPDRVRIINLSSELATTMGPKEILYHDVNMSDTHGPLATLQRYSHSKQASIRHAKELNDRYGVQGITAYSLHPGIIRSNLQKNDPTIMGAVMRMTMKITAHTTPLEGALTSLYCATSPEAPAKGQGRYLLPVAQTTTKADKWLSDLQGNRKLWEWSESAVGRVG